MVIQILPTPAPVFFLVMPGTPEKPPTRSQPTQTTEAPAHTKLATGHQLPEIDRVFHSPVKPVDTTGNPAFYNTPTLDVTHHLNSLTPVQSLNPHTHRAHTISESDPRRWPGTEFQHFRFRGNAARLRRETTQTTFAPINLVSEKRTCGETITRTLDPRRDTRPTPPFYCSQ